MKHKFCLNAINHFGLSVANLEESIKFYRDFLGLTLSTQRKNDAFFSLKNNTIFALLQYSGGPDAFDKEIRPKKKGKSFTHYGFSASSMQEVYDFQDYLIKQKIEISKKAYERWDGGSVYFTDPNGYTIEYLYFDPNAEAKTD